MHVCECVCVSCNHEWGELEDKRGIEWFASGNLEGQ